VHGSTLQQLGLIQSPMPQWFSPLIETPRKLAAIRLRSFELNMTKQGSATVLTLGETPSATFEEK